VKKKKTFLLFSVILCTGAIAACAQSPSSSQSQPKADDAIYEIEVRVAEAADAAAVGSGSKKGNKEQAPVIPEAMPEKAVGPPIASKLLHERILRFVGSVRSPPDMTRDRLEVLMQIKLTQDEKLPEWWWHLGMSTAEWTYTVFVDEGKRREFPGIDISFSAGDVEDGRRATTCTYELETFARSLTDLGYTRHPGWKQPGGHLVFSRDAAGTRFGTTVKVRKYVQQLGAEESDFQYCVYAIRVSAGESLDGK
jgi:hypothetical protein